MASLTDLFNPQFLMFLGILVLCLALLVVYFESKLRDQNHKISSMLSVVSSLADEVNLLRNSFIGGSINRMEFNPVLVEKASDLINVSDDEEELEEDDDDDEDDDDSSSTSSDSIKADSFANLKSINLDDSFAPPDYKNMPLNKLRNVAISKKLVEDASKLKKADILKLLNGLKV